MTGSSAPLPICVGAKRNADVETIGVENGIRFAVWMQQRTERPHWSVVGKVFRISRASAYRWLRAWDNAQGTQA